MIMERVVSLLFILNFSNRNLTRECFRHLSLSFLCHVICYPYSLNKTLLATSHKHDLMTSHFHCFIHTIFTAICPLLPVEAVKVDNRGYSLAFVVQCLDVVLRQGHERLPGEITHIFTSLTRGRETVQCQDAFCLDAETKYLFKYIVWHITVQHIIIYVLLPIIHASCIVL